MAFSTELIEEAQRQFSVCNACRYCEGYCAVFPALELRTAFEAGDIDYLANLCHDCRGCYQACMYTDPHPFAIDLPALLSEVRTESYAAHAFPRSLAAAFRNGPLALGVASLLAGAIVAVALLLSGGTDSVLTSHNGEGAFYQVVSYMGMVVPAMLLSAWGLAVILVGGIHFWRSTGGSWAALCSWRNWRTAWAEAGKLRWLHGGGDGCYVPLVERPSPWRKWFHHLIFYGFILTFLATISAAVAHNVLGQPSPYPVFSVPVMLGLSGGIGATVGCLGMLSLRRPAEEGSGALGLVFLVVLLLTAVSGLGLLVLRETSVMGALLVIHLVIVFALYLTAPYGKFVHAVYRVLALVRNAEERET